MPTENDTLPEIPAEIDPLVTTPPVEVVAEIPEKEVEDTTDFNDFEKAGETLEVKEPVKPKPEEKVTEVVKPEVKIDEKTGKPLEAKPKFPSTRDYTGLPEAVIPLFKTMSNDTFAALKPFYQEALTTKQKYEELLNAPPKEKGAIPDSYYEHPDNYILTPEYTKAATEAQEAQLVLEHWREQLDAVRNGATDYTTLQRNPQGQIVYGASQKVDQRSQSSLESLFFNANTQATKFVEALGSIKTSFAGKNQAAMGDLRAFEKSFFPAYEDPKHPANVVIADTMTKINPVFKSNPLAILVAKSVVTIQALSAALKDKEKAATPVVDKSKEAQKKAGPTASGVVEDTKKTGDEVSFEDFAKRME